MKSLTLTIALAFLFVIFANAQKPPEKFGKIDDDIFKTTVCPIDSNAHAYFIFDFGKTDFRYASTTVRASDASSGRKGFQMFFERQYRIKILDNNAMDWANIEIPIYHDMEGSEESIEKFRAFVYNPDGKKVDKTKVNATDLIKDKKNDYWDVMKCALPNVKAGSVIEVNYIIKSDFYQNLRSWEFQHTIPALHSEYHVYIPEYFTYNQSQWGYYPVTLEKDSRSKTLTIVYIQDNLTTGMSSSGSGRSRSERNIDYQEFIYHLTADDIPAFPVEPYLTTPDNYISKVEFELSMTKFPGSAEYHYTLSWDDVNEKLLTSSYFGDQFKHERFLKDEVEEIMASNADTPDARMEAAFKMIKDHFHWNGMNSKYVTDNLRTAYKEGNGNCADINLTLVVLLRELGLEAYPVVLSTRASGLVHPSHPSLTSFNYVIAAVRLNGGYYLMDATEPLSEINLLPTRCLNDKGWLVDERQSGWVSLLNSDKATSYTCNFEITPDGNITGKINCTFSRYGAYLERQDALATTDAASYLKEKYGSNNFKISNSQSAGLEDLYQDVKYDFDVEISDKVTQAGNLLIFEPLLIDRWNENPFKIEKREYPVEFTYPFTEMHSISVTIPEGYAVEELPEPMIVNIQDKSAKLMYSINQMGNRIQITSVFSVAKNIVLPEQYPYLKQMFDILVDKQKDQIILKKI